MRLNRAVDEFVHQIETASTSQAPVSPTMVTALIYDKLEGQPPPFARQEPKELGLMTLFQRTIERFDQISKIVNRSNFKLSPLFKAA